MEPIINSQLPEFKVQAFQNGSFKTVSHEDVKGKWAIFFLSLIHIFTIEDYSKRHHGGYLGEKSRSLCVK